MRSFLSRALEPVYAASEPSEELLDSFPDLFLDRPVGEVCRRFARALARRLDSAGIWLYVYDADIDGYYPLARSSEDLPKLQGLKVRAMVTRESSSDGSDQDLWARALAHGAVHHGALLGLGGKRDPSVRVCRAATAFVRAIHHQRLLQNLESERSDLSITKIRLESALRTNREKQRALAATLADLDRANTELKAAHGRLDSQARDLVRANAELREATVLADAANYAKGEFLARMSHEDSHPANQRDCRLRTPP